MRVLLCLALIAGAAAIAPLNLNADFLAKRQFEAWRQEHGKEYKLLGEHEQKFRTYKANLEKIAAHNAAGHPWSMAMNQFGDMTPDEFASYNGLGSLRFNHTATNPVSFGMTKDTLPTSVDWRTKGAVTPVKNQGQCGSCWAFSTTGSTEGAHFLATGKLTSLSEQELVDCAGKYGNMGCNGGLMDNGFKYIVNRGGIDTEASYPYTAKTGTTCKAKSGTEVMAPISAYTDVTTSSENDLMAAVSKQPVSIAIEADKQCFQFYSGGVLTHASCSCGTQLDHGVLAVGYGTDSGQDYWIVKNSWGETWGDAGYIKLQRGYKGTFSKTGMCGLLTQPSFPTTGASPGPSPGPAPGPAPGPSPGPSPGTSHYEDPNAGPCQTGEMAVQIQGVTGSFCSPSCANSACPTDIPSGCTANPQCALEVQGQSKPTYCALICESASKCPTNASCKMVQGAIGICTYDS